MEVRIRKTNLDDWFKDRNDYFKSNNPVLVISGLRNFAYYYGMDRTDKLTYICVPTLQAIQKETAHFPLDVLVRLQSSQLQAYGDLRFNFRKADLRFVLPDYFEKHLRNGRRF